MLLTANAYGQNAIKKPILYGMVTKAQLMQPPYAEWFDSAYRAYLPNEKTMMALKKQDIKGISVKLFFGTWCGDSQREMPRFIKLLDAASITNYQLIALGRSDSLYKQSPQHEEEGQGIYRVPTIIVYRNGTEINRINEFPVQSAEKDMLAILAGLPYSPNYRAFALLKQWMSDGTFDDANISIKSLAAQLKPLVSNEHELNSLGYLLLGQNKKAAALKVFRINFNLYYESANVNSSLGEGFYETGDNANAVYYLENALRLNKNPDDVKGILDILYKAKGVK